MTLHTSSTKPAVQRSGKHVELCGCKRGPALYHIPGFPGKLCAGCLEAVADTYLMEAAEAAQDRRGPGETW